MGYYRVKEEYRGYRVKEGYRVQEGCRRSVRVIG